MKKYVKEILEKELDRLRKITLRLESQKGHTENEIRDNKAKIDDIELDLGIVSVVLSETNPCYPLKRFYGLTVVLEQYSEITPFGLKKHNVTVLVTVDKLERDMRKTLIIINNEYMLDYDICMKLLEEEYNKANP